MAGKPVAPLSKSEGRVERLPVRTFERRSAPRKWARDIVELRPSPSYPRFPSRLLKEAPAA
jgi:hypothetical protein